MSAERRPHWSSPPDLYLCVSTCLVLQQCSAVLSSQAAINFTPPFPVPPPGRGSTPRTSSWRGSTPRTSSWGGPQGPYHRGAVFQRDPHSGSYKGTRRTNERTRVYTSARVSVRARGRTSTPVYCSFGIKALFWILFFSSKLSVFLYSQFESYCSSFFLNLKTALFLAFS